MNSRLRTLMSVFAWYAALTCAAHAQTYRAINLGQLTYVQEYVYATALNNSNQVVGYTLPTFIKPVLWQNGTVTELGRLMAGDGSQPFGINDAGEVVGNSGYATSWTNGIATSLGTLAGSSPTATSTAYAINSSGQIVGVSTPAPGGNPLVDLTAFLYSGGTMTDLNPSSALDSTATSIADNGDVAGFVFPPTSPGAPTQAALWSGGVMTLLPAVAPANSTTSTAANAINDHLQIAGAQGTANIGAMAVLWSVVGGVPTVTALGVGQAWGINNAGQIVGQSSAGATLWPQAGATGLDLNTLIDPATPLGTLVLENAAAINDNGAIVANGSRDGIHYEAVLLVPETVSLSVTPSALTFASLTVGTTSAAQTVTVHNTGATAFNLNPIQVSEDYSQTNTCGTSLPAGSQCAVSVKFTPTAPGTRSGVLTLASGGTSYPVTLTGTGITGLALTASAPTVAVGTPVTLTWKAPGTTCQASGGSAADGWMGNLPGSGSKPVTETTVGKYTYGITCTGGGQTANAQTTVSVGQPTVTLAAAPTMLSFGQATTLTWTSTFASTCTATGGANGDGWPGTKGPSGSAPITESASGSYSYTLTCGTGTVTANASVVVTVNAVMKSGGGGAMDVWSLVFLFVALGLGYPRPLLYGAYAASPTAAGPQRTIADASRTWTSLTSP